MKEKLESLKDEALNKVEQCADLPGLTQIQVEYLGRKGALTGLLRQTGSLPPEERPAFGKLANEVKNDIQGAIDARRESFEKAEWEKELRTKTIDVTLPGIRPALGHLHPITLVLQEIIRIFEGLGFEVATGPEVETEYYNFDALNMPKDHPARDMQDTFFITDSVVLRTQTSPVQIRTMKAQEPPVRIIAPGKVFRRDDDIPHSPMFFQVEGLVERAHAVALGIEGHSQVALFFEGRDNGQPSLLGKEPVQFFRRNLDYGQLLPISYAKLKEAELTHPGLSAANSR